MITPLIDDRCTELGLTVSPPVYTDGLHWELTHLFLTENGNWDAVPKEFKHFQNDHLGGDHHVYVLGHRLGGRRAEEPDLFVLGWPDGHHIFSPKREHEWWGNAVINAGFDWQAGPGPYYSQMNALNTSVVRGIGLPFPPWPWQTASVTTGRRHYWDEKTMVGDKVASNIMGGLHTSFFLVFQEVEAYNGPDPIPEQFLRVLGKAEAAADTLVGQNEKYAAAKVYLGIADILLWE